MCNLYTLDPSLDVWAAAFETFLGEQLVLSAGPDTLANQPWRTKMYPRYQGLFIRPVDGKNLAAGFEPAVGHWGVVPFFHKGPVKTWKAQTNNCRSEEMASKPSFRDSVKSRRCLIPANGICEYSGPKGSMTLHTISRADGAPLFLAGLWASHSWEGERTDSYTMVMQETGPGDDMHVFHNRQPVVLDRESARTWLDCGADYAPLLKAPPPGTLVADPPEPAAA